MGQKSSISTLIISRVSLAEGVARASITGGVVATVAVTTVTVTMVTNTISRVSLAEGVARASITGSVLGEAKETRLSRELSGSAAGRSTTSLTGGSSASSLARDRGAGSRQPSLKPGD